MLDSDGDAKAVPVRKDLWKHWFPHVAPLIDRFGVEARYDRFEFLKLKRWSSGKVAVIGDAANALPPNIGQGGGCAMMNGLSLAVYLDRERDIQRALEQWERAERPLTEHTQRISYWLGLPTTWPPRIRAFTLGIAGVALFTRMATRGASVSAVVAGSAGPTLRSNVMPAFRPAAWRALVVALSPGKIRVPAGSV